MIAPDWMTVLLVTICAIFHAITLDIVIGARKGTVLYAESLGDAVEKIAESLAETRNIGMDIADSIEALETGVSVASAISPNPIGGGLDIKGTATSLISGYIDGLLGNLNASETEQEWPVHIGQENETTQDNQLSTDEKTQETSD